MAEYAIMFYCFHRINKQAHCWDNEERLSVARLSKVGHESELETGAAGAGLVDPLLESSGFITDTTEEPNKWHIAIFDDVWYATYDFSVTYGCIFGDDWNWLLLLTRLIFMLFFVGVGTAWHFEVFPKGWNYFTNWNLTIIAFYYTLAFICSLLGFLYRVHNVTNSGSTGNHPYYWVRDEEVKRESRRGIDMFTLHRLSVVVHILFEMMGATALMITTVNFILLNPQLVFWNMTAHLFTTCSFLVEMSLTRMPVYLLHIPYMLTWSAIFCSFTWIIVAVNVRYWPYPFMPAGDITCLLWYTGLIVSIYLFYYLWRSMSKLKFYLVGGNDSGKNTDAVYGIVPSTDNHVLNTSSSLSNI